MNERRVSGFDYRAGGEFECTRRELLERAQQIEQAGGMHRRIAGDMTYFDKHGHMVIEVYEKQTTEHRGDGHI